MTATRVRVRDAMGPSYPELVTDFDRINRIPVAEATAFNRTMASGSTLFADAAAALFAKGAADPEFGNLILRWKRCAMWQTCGQADIFSFNRKSYSVVVCGRLPVAS